MPKRCWLLLSVGLAAGLSGCAVGPDYEPPNVSVPGRWATAGATSGAELERWWRTLDDRQLNALVERAVHTNLDIEAALARVQGARMEEVVAIGAALPQLDVSGTVAAGSGTDLTKGRVDNALRAGINGTGLTTVSGIVGLAGSWDLDLFGKYRRLIEAAGDDAEALDEMRHAVLITVIADVVRTYVEIRGLQSRLEAARGDVTTAQKTVDLTQERYDRGLTSEVDVAFAKRQLAMLQARIPDLNAAIFAAQRRMAVLLDSNSVPPEALRSGQLPRPPERLRPGLPIELLHRRPDIRQAERALAAATARIGAATADLFPAVSLTAGVGAEGGPRTIASVPPLLHGPIWSVGPGGYWPFLDFGRLDALIYAQEFQTREILLQYKKTILTAVAEVDTAIKGYQAARQRLTDLETALAESRRSVDLATQRYERGLTDFLNVLDAQRQQYALEAENIVAQEAVAIEFVIFYQALGGGWERYENLPPIPQAEPAVVAAFRRLSNQWR